MGKKFQRCQDPMGVRRQQQSHCLPIIQYRSRSYVNRLIPSAENKEESSYVGRNNLYQRIQIIFKILFHLTIPKNENSKFHISNDINLLKNNF